jgi:formylglycine-generating enzyme required for sulfatase activity
VAAVRENAYRACLAEAKALKEKRDLVGALAAAEKALFFKPGDGEARNMKKRLQALRSAPPGMVYIPAGPFIYGSGGDAREVPCEGFYIGAYEVTNAEYARFVAAGGYGDERFWDEEGWRRRREFVDREGSPGPAGFVRGGFPEGRKDVPVTGVSFYEARAYARFCGLRLPMEVEWEKAATWDGERGKKILEPWHYSGEAGEKVWSLDELRKVFSGYFHRPSPLSVFRPLRQAEKDRPALYDRSPCGCFGIYGNVHEWTVSAKPGAEVQAVIRGGSIMSLSSERASPVRRFQADPCYRSPALGFRLARDGVRKP